jgi:hypothetical protein
MKSFFYTASIAFSLLCTQGYADTYRGISENYNFKNTIRVGTDYYQFTETLEVTDCKLLQNWKRVLMETGSDGRSTMMLIPPDDNEENPSLLFAIRFFSHSWLDANKVECDTAGEFVNRIDDYSQEIDDQSKITTLKKDDCEVLYEQTCKKPKSITLSRVIYTGEGIHSITIASMNPFSSSQKQQWLQLLKNARVVPLQENAER